MSVIIIDGPEKAGKTTTINKLIDSLRLAGNDCEYVHWGKVFPDDRAYSQALEAHSQDMSKVWIWDRGWPSEYVYGSYLKRDRRMSTDPWIGAWLHDRAVQSNGLRVILTGPDESHMSSLRDASDLEIPIYVEKSLYTLYGLRFGWTIVNNLHGTGETDKTVNMIIDRFNSRISKNPKVYSGPYNSNVLVVGDSLSNSPVPGGWMPFTSSFTTKFAREFGDKAISILWVNSDSVGRDVLDNRKLVILCGEKASKWHSSIRHSKKGETDYKIFTVYHPSYMYRFNNNKTRRALSNFRKHVGEWVSDPILFH